MSKTQELKEGTEEILRNQFVDRAYSKSGKTTWGVDKTRDELIALFTQHAESIRKEEQHKREEVVDFYEEILKKKEMAEKQYRREAVEGFYDYLEQEGIEIESWRTGEYLKQQEVKDAK